MGKLRHSEPDIRTTTEYVRELSRQLRLPEAEASAIVDEADAHLRDRAEELVEAGATPASAEASAVAGFGSPRSFARRLSDSFYETAHSHTAFACGRALLSGLCTLAVAGSVMGSSAFARSLPGWLLDSVAWLFRPLSSYCQPFDAVVYGLLSLIGISIVACAFLARRGHTRFILGAGSVWTLTSLLAAGLYTTALPYDHHLVDRRDLRDNIVWDQRQKREVANELRLLDEGSAVYAGTRPYPAVPADLRLGGQFVAPVAWNSKRYDISVPLSLPSAFQTTVVMTREQRRRFGVAAEAAAYTYAPSVVNSAAEAGRRWKQNYSIWRAAKARELVRVEQEISETEAISAAPDAFDFGDLSAIELYPLLFTLVIAALDFAGAWAGRRTFLILRKLQRRGSFA